MNRIPCESIFVVLGCGLVASGTLGLLWRELDRGKSVPGVQRANMAPEDPAAQHSQLAPIPSQARSSTPWSSAPARVMDRSAGPPVQSSHTTATCLRLRLERSPEVAGRPAQVLLVQPDGGSATPRTPAIIASETTSGDAVSLSLADARPVLVLVLGSDLEPALQAVDPATCAREPARVVLLPRRPFDGSVEDGSTGAPVAAAELRCLPEALARYPEPTRAFLADLMVTPVQSDTEGKFRSPWGGNSALHIAYRHPAYLAGELHQVCPGSDLVQVSLYGGRRVSGQVVDEQDRPIAGATLSAGLFGRLPVHEKEIAHTDGDGHFALDRLPDAAVYLIVRAAGFAPSKRRFEEGLLGASLRIALQRESLLEGVVLDAGGHAMGGAEVAVHCLDDNLVTAVLQTDPSGNFSVPWTAAGREYLLFVSAKGHETLEWGPISPPASALEVLLPARRSWHGQVVDPDGLPVEEFTLRRVPESPLAAHEDYYWSHARARTYRDSGGRFELHGLADRPHWIQVEASGHPPLRRRIEPAAEGEEPTVLQLRRGQSISGTVVDEAGAPLVGMHLAVAGQNSRGEWHTAAGTQVVPTWASGEFRLEAVPSERFALLLSRPGSPPVVYAGLRGADFPRTLTLPTAHSLRLHVKSDYPAPQSVLSLRAGREGSADFLETRSDSAGNFRLDGLPSGRYWVDLHDHWQNTEQQTLGVFRLIVDIPQTGPVPVLRLRSDRTLRGTVQLGNPTPAHRLEVIATSPEHPERMLRSSVEQDGRFALGSLDPGRWILQLRSLRPGSLIFLERELFVPERAPIPPVQLTLPSHLIRGVVDGVDDELVVLELLREGVVSRTVVSDRRFELQLEDPAGCRLQARSHGFVSSSVELDSRNDHDITLTLRRGARISGRAGRLHAAGQLRVRLVDRESGTSRETAVLSGEFTFDGVAPGVRHDLELRVDARRVWSSELPPLHEGEHHPIQIPGDDAVDLWVELSTQGQPRADEPLRVRAGERTAWLDQSVTDAQGRARFRLLPGAYQIVTETRVFDVVLDPGPTAALKLQLP